MIPATRSPALALFCESIGRTRWALVGLATLFALMVMLGRVLPESWRTSNQAKGILVCSTAMSFIAILSIFSATATAPKSGRNGYPPRMFLLPVSTARLVAWPMLFGMAAMALGWAAIATAVLPRFGFNAPMAAGAPALAAGSAVLQLMSWWPFGSNLTQLLAASLSLPLLIVLVLWPTLVWGWGPGFLWVALPALSAGAYAMAVRGVALDRRGDGRGGRSLLARFEALVERMPGMRPRFATAEGAQRWFEWRSKGAALLFLVIGFSAFAAFFVAVLPAYVDREPSQARGFLAAMLVMPLMLCWMMGSSFGRDDLWSRSIALSPFLATRPLSSGAMAAIRLRAAARSMLAAFGFILLTLPLWFLATGNFGPLAALVRSAAGARGPAAIALIAATGLALILMLTWRGMVGAMVPVLTGRPWVTTGLVYLSMALTTVAVLIGLALRVGSEDLLAWSSSALPWTLAIALVVKLVVATIAFRAADRRGLVSRAGLAGAGLVWLVPTACAIATAAALLRPTSPVVWLDVALASAVISPLGRLALAPLALDWNRHR